MRYSYLILLSTLLLFPTSVTANQRTEQEVLLAQRRNQGNFWLTSEALIHKQLSTLAYVETAFSSPEYNQVNSARASLLLHLGKVERFLKSQYPQPNLLCFNNGDGLTSPSNLNSQQTQVYCTLYKSLVQLEPIVKLLDRRLPSLSALATADPFPATNEELPRDLLRTYPFDFDSPVPSRFYRVETFPEQEIVVVEGAEKKPIADYTPPLQPALPGIPGQALLALQTTRKLLLDTQPLFPYEVKFRDWANNEQVIEDLSYGLLPPEPSLHKEFLEQPNTGIIHILSAEAYNPNPNQIRNRLKNPVTNRFPLAALVPPKKRDFVPRLNLQIRGDDFEVIMAGLNYGFMVNLGNIPIIDLIPEEEEDLLEDIPSLTQPQKDIFLNYRPPEQLQVINEHKQRFILGQKTANLGVLPMPALTKLPIQRNHTYLLRLVQYELPEALITGEAIPRSERRYLYETFDVPSSDLLVAFRPVHRRIDGTYTVLWRVIKEFDDPQIVDLEDYVELE